MLFDLAFNKLGSDGGKAVATALERNGVLMKINLEWNDLGPDGGKAIAEGSGAAGASKDGLPPNMKFSRTASYNNPHEMFPSASKLFSGTLINLIKSLSIG